MTSVSINTPKIILVIQGGVLVSAVSNISIQVVVHDADDLFDTHSPRQQQEILNAVSEGCDTCNTCDSLSLMPEMAEFQLTKL